MSDPIAHEGSLPSATQGAAEPGADPAADEKQRPEETAAKAPSRRRRRGSRGRRRSAEPAASAPEAPSPPTAEARPDSPAQEPPAPEPPRPRIGDTRPAPPPPPPLGLPPRPAAADLAELEAGLAGLEEIDRPADEEPAPAQRRRRRRSRARERRGRPVGRYLMCVHVQDNASQVAVLEGRSLIEHYLSRPQDSTTEIDGNIYLGKVQNVLPGMEAAFVDIGTPKNAVLYRGDVYYDRDDVESGSGSRPSEVRIEQLLRQGQTILCQVTKNPIGTKGARLTQEVSLPGRFVVLVPNSDTYGISKRLPEDERRRLRKILDAIRPKGHGLIVRTAAEGASAAELARDVELLVRRWAEIDAKARRTPAPALLYAEPDMAVRVIREEFNANYRGVIIDDRQLYEQVRDYVASITPDLADRVEFYDPEKEQLPLFERHHVHEQLHKALDRKVWLPSGGSIIIERTEALTVIDVNTGKNVGRSSLEETVFRNNCEAAEEIARQLRLRDIGGIIVIDFIDMEQKANREGVMKVFREALARDKTRTQVFDMSELGLVQMTRKRVSEGLVESFSKQCPVCNGRGIVFDESLL